MNPLDDVKSDLETAKDLIQSREGYDYSEYRFDGRWERENAEYDARFAKGVDLLERIARSEEVDIEDRIDALSILADIYEDGRINCRSQFDPVDDCERLEWALVYYKELSRLDVAADDRAKAYYTDSIVRVQTMIAALPDDEQPD